MDSYAQARQKERSNAEIMGQKRQEKALREFKQVLEDLVYLLRSATGMETVYLYWINRSREQFVMETKSTSLENVMFQDRVAFADHYLDQYKNITEPHGITIGDQINAEALAHYYDEVPVSYITLLPFLNNGETVAITVLESSDQIFSDDRSEVIYAYINALRNVLNTYLEISDLYQKQEEWVDYESSLEVFDAKVHHAELIRRTMNTMQGFLQKGGVSFIANCMNSWCNIANSGSANLAPPIGLPLEARTICYEALQKGKPEFAIHFNHNPKRISPREKFTEGASLAIPVIMNDRRQGVFLAYDENPLIFKESTKHKLINMVRIAGLKIQAENRSLDPEENIFTNQYESLLPDMWERTVDAELQRIRADLSSFHTWFGLITLSNLPAIRTKLRMEDLDQLRKDLSVKFNPGRRGIPGVIGFNSDYVYTFIIQSNDEKAVGNWTRALKEELKEPFELSNGNQVETGIKVGYTTLNAEHDDAYQVLSEAKAALTRAVRTGTAGDGSGGQG